MTLLSHLNVAAQRLKSVTDVAHLEAEILLAHALHESRGYLYARLNEPLALEAQSEFEAMINRRVSGEPIAYITKHKEFWSLDLVVTKDVLIPRPETELLVELALTHGDKKKFQRVADLGTGSGAIALALAKECPPWDIYATDQSSAALKLAKKNAIHHGLKKITFLSGEWCAALPNLAFDMIISNPPYLAEDDEHLRQGDLRFEPLTALVAEGHGLSALQKIVFGARHFLKNEGYLFLEHGCQQGASVGNLLSEAGYQSIKIFQDLAGLDRVTVGRYPRI
jgi:release factor glutamine methyltransferase